MQYDLREGLQAERPMALGYSLVPWSESTLNAHAKAKYDSFRSELDANVFPCLGDADGCFRLMREISARRGFVARATWLAIFTDAETGRVTNCGTVQGLREHTDVGSIQNLGVAPEHRGTGIGSAMLARSLEGFHAVGIKFVTLEVTAQNYGALRLYQRMGFRTLRTVFKSIDVTAG